MLHSAGGHKGSRKAHQAGNQAWSYPILCVVSWWLKPWLGELYVDFGIYDFFSFAILSAVFLSVSEISCFRTLVSSWWWMVLHSSKTWVCNSSPSPHTLQRMLFYLLLILFFASSILVLALNIILALCLGSPFMHRALFSRFPSVKTFQ